MNCPICNAKLKASWIKGEVTPLIDEGFKTMEECKLWNGQIKPLVPIFICPHGCYNNIPITTKEELQQWVEDVVLGNREDYE